MCRMCVERWSNNGPMRLNAYLARAGVASRRGADELMKAGRVTVNGEPGELKTFVGANDVVSLDGERLQPQELAYVLLHKPAGVVTTARDPQGRRTVVDLVDHPVRVVPVGRLDADTTGALLPTNDGDLAHRLAHPRYEVDKVYEVEVEGERDDAALERRLDLHSECVALRGQALDLPFDRVVRAVTRVVARERVCRRLQRVHRKSAEGRVQLLVRVGQLVEAGEVHLHRRWNRVPREVTVEQPPVMAVVVLQADQGQHRRAEIGVIRPGLVGSRALVDSRSDHADPGGGDLVLDVAMVPGEALARPRRDERAWRPRGA